MNIQGAMTNVVSRWDVPTNCHKKQIQIPPNLPPVQKKSTICFQRAKWIKKHFEKIKSVLTGFDVKLKTAETKMIYIQSTENNCLCFPNGCIMSLEVWWFSKRKSNCNQKNYCVIILMIIFGSFLCLSAHHF